MDLINLTPGEVRLLTREGEEAAISPSGTVATVSAVPREVGVVWIDGQDVPAVATWYGAVEGLPEARRWTRYIVSSVVQQAACLAGRHDTLVPHDLVRDEQGRVVGARSLQVCCSKARVERW